MTSKKKPPRYVTSEGWGHIFAGNKETTTRWVLDRESDQLVDTQLLDTRAGMVWKFLSKRLTADLLEDIRCNDVDSDPDTWGVIESNQLPGWARSPLQQMASLGDVNGCLKAIASGTPIDERHGGTGNTALHFAALFEQIEVCIALLEAGSDSDARNVEGLTPAQAAAEAKGHQTHAAISAWRARHEAGQALIELSTPTPCLPGRH